MPSLKEALLKAGLVTAEKLKKAEEAKRKPQASFRKPVQQKKPSTPPPPPKPVEKVHEHHLRTFCEHCKKSSPDVEYYQHTNKSLKHYWLCVKCADEHSISDHCRQTHQSGQAQMGLFRREYGATKVFQPGSHSS
ncbi:MAG: hypothetical protein Q7S98_02740 [Deltaproteobacteria bacterium]|nr:hypothetical protein [Deltaproteobacteria bacterium]